MAYGKKMAKRVYKSNPVQKRVDVYGKAGVQLYKDVMYLKSLINSEPKFHLVTVNNNVDWNGAMISCCDVVAGDGATNRDGDRILPRWFGINMRLHTGELFTGKHLGARVIIFRWWGESPNAPGVSPLPSEVLDNMGTQNGIDSFLKRDITGSKGDRNRRIEVLRNYYKVFDNTTGDSSMVIQENIEMNRGGSVKEHMEYFDSNTHPPTSGGIFVLITSETNTATDLAYHFTSKLTFYDN